MRTDPGDPSRFCGCCSSPFMSRRGLLASGAASLGLAAVGDPHILRAQTTQPQRIDIHHHFAPPAWLAAVRGREMLQRANTEWTPARSIEDMDRAGVGV